MSGVRLFCTLSCWWYDARPHSRHSAWFARLALGRGGVFRRLEINHRKLLRPIRRVSTGAPAHFPTPCSSALEARVQSLEARVAELQEQLRAAEEALAARQGAQSDSEVSSLCRPPTPSPLRARE